MSYARILPKFSFEEFTVIATVDISGLHSTLDRSNNKPLFIGIPEHKPTQADFASNLEVFIEMQVRQDYFANLVHSMHQAEVPNERKAIAAFVMDYATTNGGASNPLSRSTSVMANVLEDIKGAINMAMVRKANDILNPESE